MVFDNRAAEPKKRLATAGLNAGCGHEIPDEEVGLHDFVEKIRRWTFREELVKPNGAMEKKGPRFCCLGFYLGNEILSTKQKSTLAFHYASCLRGILIYPCNGLS